MHTNVTWVFRSLARTRTSRAKFPGSTVISRVRCRLTDRVIDLYESVFTDASTLRERNAAAIFSTALCEGKFTKNNYTWLATAIKCKCESK